MRYINASVLLSLLLANIRIKIKLALAVPAGAPITLEKEIIDTPPVVALNTIKILFIWSKVAIYLFNFWLYDFLWLISLIKQF